MSGSATAPCIRFACVLVVALTAPLAAAADFAGAGGSIPDGDGTGRTISFSVSGVVGPVTALRIRVDLSHAQIGDLDATLISPGGTAQLTLIGRAGLRRSSSAGDFANANGSYLFDDAASVNPWSAIAGLGSSDVLPPGSYRTTTGGHPGLSDQGGCATWLTLAFGGLSGAQVNGAWTLKITDLAFGNIGSVSSALLSIDSNPRPSVFASGFEDGKPSTLAPPSGDCRKAKFDYTGIGTSSYVLVGDANPDDDDLAWLIRGRHNHAPADDIAFVHGRVGDEVIDGDFDGDGIADAIVWRPSSRTFLIRRSSRPTDTTLSLPFGAANDDPAHLGDYDGDGITDAAVFRQGEVVGAASRTLVLGSKTGSVHVLTTGENGAFAVGGVDYDDDSRADIAVESNAGDGVARFRLFRGPAGAQIDDFTFGVPTDLLVAGNHTGSARSDITVVRGIAGAITWSTRDMATGFGQPDVTFGVSTTDRALTGDYDGDGLDDHAVWRASGTPGLSAFFIRRSTLPSSVLEVRLGKNGDYPVANSRVH
jgi:subtilisin-like proprotein convertase family protein